jgi:hypothetical protein
MLQRRQGIRPEDPDSLGRRRACRVRIVLPASAQTVSGRKEVRLLNLSTTGAMLEGPSLPASGQDVVIKCGATDAFGTVVWSIQGRCGILFDRPIDPADVERHRQDGANSASSGISPEENQAALDWVRGRTR